MVFCPLPGKIPAYRRTLPYQDGPAPDAYPHKRPQSKIFASRARLVGNAHRNWIPGYNHPKQKAASSSQDRRIGRFPARGCAASDPQSIPRWYQSRNMRQKREKCGVQICAGMNTTSGQHSNAISKKVAAVQTQDGPSIRMEVADAFQTLENASACDRPGIKSTLCTLRTFAVFL